MGWHADNEPEPDVNPRLNYFWGVLQLIFSKLGSGVIYTATSGLEKLRRELSASEREVLLDRF